MPSVRRSRRSQVPNKKYTNDLSDEINDILGSDSEVDANASSDEANDEEFDEQDAIAAAQDEIDIEEDQSDVEVARSSAGEDAVDIDADYEQDLVEFEKPSARREKKSKREILTVEELSNLPAFDPRATKPSRYDALHHTRGIIELGHRDTRQKQIITSFGYGTEDLAAYIRTRGKWYDQIALPTAVPNPKSGLGGLTYSFFYPETKRDKERNSGWQWYYVKGGYEAFKRNQNTAPLPLKQSYNFRPAPTSRCNLIYGSIVQPKYLRLSPGQAINLASAFESKAEGRKNGFLLNIGWRVQCLEWIPNQSGNKQYLCISVLRSSYQDHTDFLKDTDRIHGSKAFTPSPRYRSCMEVWEFDANGEDALQDPRCRAIFSWDWGDLKRMQWCPVPTPPDRLRSDSGKILLGLLAGIWSDGYIRVLDLSLSGGGIDSIQYTHISDAAFESRPPDTLCTSLSWLSSQNLAASCANGFAAIWDLATILTPHATTTQQPKSSTTGSRPWFYHCLHFSYIFGLTSGYPSRPHMLFSTSIDGHIRITDARSPTTDTAAALRTRVQLPPLAWSDHSQALLSTDEGGALKLNPLRRFFSATAFARCSGLVTDIATSVLHPFVLASCADGTVWACNPVRRVGGKGRGPDAKGGAWVVCWFEHTWRRGTVAGNEDDEDAMEVDGQEHARSQVLQQPLVRIVDGFKAVKTGVGPSTGDSDGKKKKATPPSSVVTIHEERTAISKVSWNPNLRFGTWAAAGTASGLVRIENLAVDGK